MSASSDSPTDGPAHTPIGAPIGLAARARRRLADPLGLLVRVEQLEAEAIEARRLNLRIAELTDLVSELVVPLARLDPERAAPLIEKYQAGLGQ